MSCSNLHRLGSYSCDHPDGRLQQGMFFIDQHQNVAPAMTTSSPKIVILLALNPDT